MSERSRESLIERIRGLLKKTQANGCSEAEAATAFKLATRLMAEHELGMADVEIQDAEAADWVDEPAFNVSRWAVEQNLTYAIVREFCYVECHFDRVLNADRTRYVKRLMIFGKPENVENARFMFTALLNANERLWTSYHILNRAPASDRRIDVTGVAQGFRDKMRDEREALKIERDLMGGNTGGTALALANVQEKVGIAMRERNPGLKKSRGGFSDTRGSSSALEVGLRAGRDLSLNWATAVRRGAQGHRGPVQGLNASWRSDNVCPSHTLTLRRDASWPARRHGTKRPSPRPRRFAARWRRARNPRPWGWRKSKSSSVSRSPPALLRPEVSAQEQGRSEAQGEAWAEAGRRRWTRGRGRTPGGP